MFKTKKIVALAASAALILSMAVGCNNANNTSSDDDTSSTVDLGEINVISREDGSGTRGAFVELMGIVDENDKDATTVTAEITNSTSVMMSTVAGNESAIGYVSLGSLYDDVKALKVDGVEATPENVKSGDYKVSRPFVICYVEDKLSDLAKDFISYIMSADGQQLLTDEKYISVADGEAYAAPETALSGEISISGSTSVGPVMEKLAAAYMEKNKDVKISIEQNGSGAGIKAATEGVSDIGMSSRELKDSEKEKLADTKIALDGVAVIVNKANTVENLTSEQIKNIFLGEVTEWADVQ
ncbi:MAG: extracellular solute-binding protein [Firmicutes bacterium]|nr:extracellular solute-binding protein [Bacillota bacterium]